MDVFGIRLSELDLWLLGAAGTCLALLISHLLSKHRERRTSHRNAIAAFHAAFAPDLFTLRELQIHQTGEVHDVLRAAYPRHEAAFLDFERTLSTVGRLFLRRRWMKYRGPYPIAPEFPSEDRRYRLAHFIGSTVDDEEAKKNQAISVLVKLTAYSV